MPASENREGQVQLPLRKVFPVAPTHPLLPEEWLEFLRAGDKGRGSDKQSEA